MFLSADLFPVKLARMLLNKFPDSFPNEKCYSKPKDVCHDVPNEVCNDAPRKQYTQVPVQAV